MAEEPEQVLPEDGAAVRRRVDLSVQMSIDVQHEQRRGEDREREQHQQAGDQDVPGEDRHSEHRHARAARSVITVVIMLTPPRMVPRPEMPRPMIHRSVPDARRVEPVVERHVEGPAAIRRAARRHEAGRSGQRAEEVEPVGERVEPRERDIRRADLQRQDQIGEGEDEWRREEQQHDRAVHREQLVVLLRRQELHARPGQLRAHEQGHEAAERRRTRTT